jgi:large subunit ribosomal protein L32e
MKEALEKRNIAKKKKPTFLRQDSNKYSFNNKWRKPRGLHNKRRLSKKGHQKNPSIGYSSPKEVKYLNKDGLNRILIATIKDLKLVNKDKDIIVLSSKLGIKKKIEILEKIIESNLKLENIKDPKLYIQTKKSEFEEKKKEKKERISKKEKAKAESLKKSKEKEEKEGAEEDKQKEIKEEVQKAPQKEIKQKQINVKQDTTQQKAGHQASGVPGTKQ